MDQDFVPLQVKPVIAGVLVATLGAALALSIFIPTGKPGSMSLDLIVRSVPVIAAAMLTVAVPLILLVCRKLQDPATRTSGWGTHGIKAGMIAAAVIALGLFVAMILFDEFGSVLPPIAAVIFVVCIIVGCGIGLMARPIALHFDRNW